MGKVQQIFFVINVYDRKQSFATVRAPYCRIMTSEGGELCKYLLSEAGRQQGLIVARLIRSPGDERWGFQALGEPCRGTMYKDSLPAMQQMAEKRPTALQS